MAKSYAQLLEKQRFDDLMDFLDSEFRKLPDHRRVSENLCTQKF
jgi:hypothetical protein